MSPIQKFFFPTDLCEVSSSALHQAAGLALEHNAELVVIHVLPVCAVVAPDMVYVPYESDRERMDEALREVHRKILPNIPTRVRSHAEIKIGYTAEEIVCAAETEACDLIVMSTHGHTGLQHLALGSVAEEVVRRSSCPVLTVRQTRHDAIERDTKIRRIICPTDFSEPSLDAMRQAGELALLRGAELRVLHVLEPVHATARLVEREDYEESRAFDAAEALSHLIEDHVPSQIVENVKLHRMIRQGHAAEIIVQVAREQSFDLIVIATHGRTGWRHLIFGSVAEEVLRTAECPVLTVHMEAVPVPTAVSC